MKKICKRCGKTFSKPYNESKKNWAKHIYCSRKCCYPEKVIRICQQCGKEFSVRGKRKHVARFCSKKCDSKFKIGNPNNSSIKFKIGHKPWNADKRIKVKCAYCGKVLLVPPSNINYHKKQFCNKECYNKWQGQQVGEQTAHWQGGKIKKICILCGKEFYVNRYRVNVAKFCSKNCSAKSRVGEDSANWKGGIDLENKRARQSLEYEIWRKEVYKRDNWTCRICGKKCKAKDIVAHHLKLFSEFPELRFSVDNGIVLCRSCHLKVHKNMGIKTEFTD